MMYGLYVSAAGMAAQETRQSVLSNNLANAQTTGFKRDLAVMQARNNAVHEDFHMMKYAIPVLNNQGGGVDIGNGGIDLQQGPSSAPPMPPTSPSTAKAFSPSRAKRPAINSSPATASSSSTTTASSSPPTGTKSSPTPANPSLLINRSPSPSLPADKSPRATAPAFNSGLPTSPTPATSSNSATTSSPSINPNPSPRSPRNKSPSNTLESSGVDPIIEMVNMMEGQRAFEANAKMISYQDTTLSELNTIGKIA